MNTKSNEVRERIGAPSDAGRGISARLSQYMIAPSQPGISESAVQRQLQEVGGVEVIRTTVPDISIGPPVIVARMPPERAAALRRSTGGALVVELDERLRCAMAFALPAPLPTTTLNTSFTATIQVLSDNNEALDQAEVQLVGEQGAAQGITGSDGKVTLTVYGDRADTLTELTIKPRAGHWGLWKREPWLKADAVNVVALRPLSETREPAWGGRALQLDRLPPEYRGGGVKVALIDSGVATSHKQLSTIGNGFALPVAGTGQASSWSQDPAGHGTGCAGIISAAWDTPRVQVVAGPRGYASEAELHMCKLPPEARSSDLVAALDHCMAAGVDIACVGFGCRHGSTIVEQRIVAAKQQGIAIIAAAGSDGGQVQFPASSPHVLAVAAIGRTGTFPDDSPHAAHAASAVAISGGYFVPAFSCRGLELDLCAPGVAVICCQSPEGYAARDGTSLAASHIAAIAALLLAHHVDFRRDFAGRDPRRVERLFQILKETAQPLGNPALTGAGLPSVPLALGLQSHMWPLHPGFEAGLDEMRYAVRRAALFGRKIVDVPGPQPQRGPALVAPMPLTPMQPQPLLDPQTGISDLKAAMRMAGLERRH